MRRPVRLHIKATESSSAATIHNEKMTAVAISIVQAACEQPNRIRASPATVAGARPLLRLLPVGGDSFRFTTKRLREFRLNRGNGFVPICKAASGTAKIVTTG